MQALPLIAELEAALASGAARRVEMLARITELFVSEAARYSEEQVGVFDDVMVRLASTVDADARAKLAQRLAPIANAPSSLIHMLAFDDEIEVARPVLSQSERLEDSALRANAGSKSQQHLLAIAQRRSLSETVTDVLIERGDREVLRALVNNAGSRFSEAGFRMLVERAAGDDDLATAIRTAQPFPSRAFRRPGARTEPQSRWPHRRSRTLSLCARPQIRGNRARAVDPVRHADRPRRAGAARSDRRDHSHPRQSRRACRQRRPRPSCCCGPPTAACRRRTSITRC